MLSGTWNDLNCGSAELFICERLNNTVRPTVAPTSPPPKGGCPEDWLLSDNKVQYKMSVHCILKRAKLKTSFIHFFSCSRVFSYHKTCSDCVCVKTLKIQFLKQNS